MVPELRRRHRLIWGLFAFLLPIFYVLGILSIPSEPNSVVWQESQAIAALPQVEHAYANEAMAFNLRTNGSQYQIEVDLQKPMRVASAVVYLYDIPVGQLNSVGKYRFPILKPEGSLPVKIVDAIKQEVLWSFDLLQPH